MSKIISFTPSSGGDVTGPGSSTDNAVARFDGVTGKIIQSSSVTIDDSGNIATAGNVDGRDVSTDGSTLDSHVASTSNPHTVTKTQVGLANVTNDAQLKISSNLSDLASASSARTNLGLGTAALLDSDTDTSFTANSDIRLPTQKAVKAYVDNSVVGLLDIKGGTDCSTEPNYPAALKGDAYYVTVAGKIGGASGAAVDANDVYVASADNAGGTQASVGTSWFVLEHNLVGALLSANNLSDISNASTARTNLGLGTLATQSGTFSGTSSGTNTGDQTITLTGNVTGSGTGGFAATIANSAVTYAKIQDISATDKLLGRSTAGSGVVEEIACTAAGRAILDDADASAQRTTLGLGSLATQSGTFSGTSSGTNTGDQNLFSTISVSGQSDVVADTTSDTLTLVAGTNIMITTDAATDAITINATGGSGTVTSVSVTTANGVSGSVATATTTPAITLTLGAITPSSVAAVGTVTGSNLSGTNTGDQTITLTGNVTGSGTGGFAATIANDAVTYAKMQNVSATDKILGRSTIGAGDVEEIACTAAGRAILDDVDAAAQRTTLGLGTLATQSGTFSGTSSGTNTGDQTITLTGNVTGSGTGSFVATIANDAVTYAKMQNVSGTDKILGRSTAGSGDVEEITCTAAGRALLDDDAASTQRATLGLVIGTNVQAYDAELAAIASLTSAADRLPYFTGLGTAFLATFTAAGRALVDDATAADQRVTLGLRIGTDVQAYDAELAAIAGLTSAADRLPYFTGLGTASLATFTTAGRALMDDASAAAQVTTLGLDNTKIASVGITIDGGGSAITTGVKGYIEVPYACTINRVTMLADQSGSIVVDIWKDTYANFAPTVADTITASAKPTISSATKSQDSTLTGWTTSVAAGDILAFNVDSASTITRLNLVLKVTKT